MFETVAFVSEMVQATDVQRPVSAMADAVGVRALADQRHDVILAELRRKGSVRVTELATLLGVSDMTVRRDLDHLNIAGHLVKVHGGATLRNERSTDEPGFQAKSHLNLGEKHAIALAAAQLVTPGSAIGITAGTTTWQLAYHLVDIPAITVVTNSVRVADVLHDAGRTDHTVVLTGGIRTPSDALVGPVARSMLHGVHLDLVFMGVHGISERVGYSTPNMMEAETNRAFLAATDRLAVLADHTKWNVYGLSSIAPLDAAQVLVTDHRLTPATRELLESAIDHVIFTEPFTRDELTTRRAL